MPSNNQTIAKNTILLYIRTFIVLIISLYTSRVVLKALGAEDLGIYNVVGGLVALVAFFRIALSKSTSRFITYELGKNSEPIVLKNVFSSAMTIHVLIVIIVFLLGETAGLYVFERFIDIPENRYDIAFIVYQCSLVVLALQILTAPYESVAIAYENMSVYAYISIISAVLKLIVALLLIISPLDRLLLYSILIVIVDAFLLILYWLYVKKRYPVFSFSFKWDAEYSRKMFSFSGWTLLGSSANAATQQGVSILFNNFVGLIANTALGFANQVNAAVTSFVGSFQTAFNPQVIKLYSQGDYSHMHLLMLRASKFSFILAYVLALPLIVNMDFVLHIWLGEVPEYTVAFCQLFLVCGVIDSTTGVFNTAITATGDIKGFQIGITISYILDVIVSTILLLLRYHPALVFGSRILTRGLINMFIGLFFVRKQLKFSIRNYCRNVLIPILLSLITTIPIICIVTIHYDGWKRLLISVFLTIFLCFILAISVYLNRDERMLISNVGKRKLFNKRSE